jgi:flavin reductase (DIM6/NTAB) family NADH-FMN oxidoreductase RutF
MNDHNSDCEFEIDLCRPAPDQRGLRQALGRYATGVCVITTRTPRGRLEGLTANSFTSVSLDPPLVLWSLRTISPALAGFQEAGCYAVNVLDISQTHLSRHFTTPIEDRFADLPWSPGMDGCPLLHGALARFECRTEQAIQAGDHVMFLGRVQRATYRDGAPLVYANGGYCTATGLAPAG